MLWVISGREEGSWRIVSLKDIDGYFCHLFFLDSVGGLRNDYSGLKVGW